MAMSEMDYVGGGGKVYQGTFTAPTSGTLKVSCPFKPKAILAYGKKNSPSATNFYCRQFYDEDLCSTECDLIVIYASNDNRYGASKTTIPTVTPTTTEGRGEIYQILDDGFMVNYALSIYSRDYDFIAYG